ncbi:Clavaminate synthase-like protein [Tilletiaria anomala UBC 951]|uniref:JmjC domain-containing histone demethylation protein 1 n=1 Tax=Tilletiaria anomala (strain ATCC 24038 / CBS 436.72 / UBC 951) TaxID=1037660 RepID=A0A066VWU8_TILAU|nr:Clavaminate synthase-like protein [Tilletiaria anomala UBC 951]KDN44758.1 Clavaminate synthase-like protein [Tilletiaria anomala UBC 951]
MASSGTVELCRNDGGFMHVPERALGSDLSAGAASSMSVPVMALASTSELSQVTTPQAAPTSGIHDQLDSRPLPTLCPSCPPLEELLRQTGSSRQADTVSWIQCSKSSCRTWYHAHCMSLDPELFSRWYCPPCIDASVQAPSEDNGRRVMVLANKLKPIPRRTGRQRTAVDYAAVEQGRPPNAIERWKTVLECNDKILPDRYRRMHGYEWNMRWIVEDETAFANPVLVPGATRRKLEAQRAEELRSRKENAQKRRGEREARKAQFKADQPGLESDSDSNSGGEAELQPAPISLEDIQQACDLDPGTTPNSVPAAMQQKEPTAADRHDAFAIEPANSKGGDVVSASRLRPGMKPVRTSIPGMQVPPPGMTIWDIADVLGHHTPIEVIDVESQTSSFSSTNSTSSNFVTHGRIHHAWNLATWAEYFYTAAEKRRKVLNVISLEVSGTPMEEFVQAPELVRQLDWVTRDWPSDKISTAQATMKGSDGTSWPKVQRYVLMGVQGAYTDFHVDFAASSVYYHVVFGQKTFLFAPPTTRNLKQYRLWSSSTRQDVEWLGKNLEQLTRVDVFAGDTLLIPSGWIHAVYTPLDTLVVGGNFLHDLGAAMQLRLVEIENQSLVQRKAKFPHLKRLLWYVAHNWTGRLKGCTQASPLEAIPVLPPRRKVFPGLRLVLQMLEDDIELLDEVAAGSSKSPHGPAALKKEVKAAKEAIPFGLAKDNAKNGRAMLVELRELLDKKQEAHKPKQEGKAVKATSAITSEGVKQKKTPAAQPKRKASLAADDVGSGKRSKADPAEPSKPLPKIAVAPKRKNAKQPIVKAAKTTNPVPSEHPAADETGWQGMIRAAALGLRTR